MAGPHRRSAAWQASNIDGICLFDLRTSNRALRINRFFWHMIRAPLRERCLPDAEVLMQKAELTKYEKALIRTRDLLGLVQYGVKFFVIEKSPAWCGRPICRSTRSCAANPLKTSRRRGVSRMHAV
ncbi:protocatechuate 4,5-dioxygenase subunit alpha [Xanthomonas fragariae LMG 25863]|nr:protocatechuate 4,5-dioxygenase subunit alpha [Xanthomonas fragariae LMG 25863]